MKIALYISGYLRSFKLNIDAIKEYIINKNDVDVYIHITTTNEHKYLNEDYSFDFIIKELNPKILIASDNLLFNSENETINNIYNQHYKFYLLNEERKNIEKIENFQYDLLFKIRPDVNLQNPINFDNDLNIIHIPNDSKIDKGKLRNIDDGYLCDVMAYGSPNIMDKYFKLYKHLDNLIEKYGTVNETLLYYFLLEKNIPYKLIELNYIIILSTFNVIAITGDSGSGKTTISNIIKKLFNNSFLLECDRYHKWERGNYNWNEYTHLNPDANYITKMNQDVFDLKLGNNIYQVDYDHKVGRFTDKECIESKENVIVCGLHSLYLSENMLNLKIYMDTHDNLRIPFKIKRDISKRGYSIEKIYEQIKKREDDYKKYIYPQKNVADIVISMYTDKEFQIETYDMDEELSVYLKIGINKKYHLEKMIKDLFIEKIEFEEPFYYLFFNKDYDYESIVKTLLMNYHCKI